MLKNNRHGKDPTRILRQVQVPQISKELKTLKQIIRNFISQLLDFGTKNTGIQNIVKCLMDANISKSQLLQLWNDSILTELKKFAFKVNTIANLQMKTNLQKVGKNAMERLENCTTLIIAVLKSTSTKKNWCCCNRSRCPARLDAEICKRKIKNYVLSHLCPQLKLGNKEGQNMDSQHPNFLNIRNDPQCQTLSLQRITNQRKSQISVAQFLIHLKISIERRSNCNLDKQWVNSFHTKRKQLQP